MATTIENRRRAGWAGWAVALLAARNVAGRWLPDGWYVPVNVGVGALLLAMARRDGASWDTVGVGRQHLGKGLRVGGLLAAGALAVMAVGAALPFTRGFFDDERVDVDAGGGELAFQTLVRIPIGTAAFEELAFRGVLLAMLRRRMGVGPAVVVDSALFGLWHIGPTHSNLSANGVEGAAVAGLITGSVIATGAGGALFCWLRLRAGHLVAPMLLHLAFNDTGYGLAWWIRS